MIKAWEIRARGVEGGDFTDKGRVPRRDLTLGMDFLFTNLSISLLFTKIIGNDIKAGVAVLVI
jgi:hypothetical protein